MLEIRVKLVNPYAELRRGLPGYRLVFKYTDDDNKEPSALNECDNNCCLRAARFCYDFFSINGFGIKCFTDYTKIQTYRWPSGEYPPPFNGMDGGRFEDDADRLHLMYRDLPTTCSKNSEAVVEISTVCKDAVEKFKQYAEVFQKEHPEYKIEIE